MRILTILGLALSLFGASSAWARARYGSAGCGLGSIIMPPGTGPVQVLAFTFNNISFNQSSGITSGTSNCVAGSQAAAMEQQEQFITTNLASVAKEMAQGGGDTLDAFAQTFGCRADAVPRFARVLHQRAALILAAPGALATLDAVVDEIKGDDRLVEACTLII